MTPPEAANNGFWLENSEPSLTTSQLLYIPCSFRSCSGRLGYGCLVFCPLLSFFECEFSVHHLKQFRSISGSKSWKSIYFGDRNHGKHAIQGSCRSWLNRTRNLSNSNPLVVEYCELELNTQLNSFRKGRWTLHHFPTTSCVQRHFRCCRVQRHPSHPTTPPTPLSCCCVRAWVCLLLSSPPPSSWNPLAFFFFFPKHIMIHSWTHGQFQILSPFGLLSLSQFLLCAHEWGFHEGSDFIFCTKTCMIDHLWKHWISDCFLH